MLGITLGVQSKAYPLKAIYAATLIEDRIGSLPVLIVVGPDHASLRAFSASPAGQNTPLTFIPSAASAGQAIMTDTETNSSWNFRGCAISGKFSGQCLEEIDSHKDYWFDWLNHNPSTTVFKS
jgi:hypothetical protein